MRSQFVDNADWEENPVSLADAVGFSRWKKGPLQRCIEHFQAIRSAIGYTNLFASSTLSGNNFSEEYETFVRFNRYENAKHRPKNEP